VDKNDEPEQDDETDEEKEVKRVFVECIGESVRIIRSIAQKM